MFNKSGVGAKLSKNCFTICWLNKKLELVSLNFIYRVICLNLNCNKKSMKYFYSTDRKKLKLYRQKGYKIFKYTKIITEEYAKH